MNRILHIFTLLFITMLIIGIGFWFHPWIGMSMVVAAFGTLLYIFAVALKL